MQMPPSALADLHWLLTSPTPLTPALLPADIALGDALLGRQWWHAQAASVMADEPASERWPDPFRLGRYAEGLMRTGLDHLPGHTLVASQLPVRSGGISEGEYDFLLQAPGIAGLLHIELAVKIYLAVPTAHGVRYVGPGLRDAFDVKLARLSQHQLQLSTTPAGRAALPLPGPVQPMAWLRGWLFYRNAGDVAKAQPALAADHLRGWWRCHGEALPQSRADSRWRTLSKWQWLASGHAAAATARFEEWSSTLDLHFAARRTPVMVAEYAPPAEGGYELARGMIVPADWPDPALLAALESRIAAAI
jgi:hypothetical protein